MSYESALEAAGAKVLESKYFGSYQGDWLALVDYKGQRGFVHGSYGSCSGCDAFEAEFGYSDAGCGEHYYHPQEDCGECKDASEAYQKRLAEFGRGYMEDVDGVVDLRGFDETIANLDRNSEWDYEAPQMVAWATEMKANYAE